MQGFFAAVAMLVLGCSGAATTPERAPAPAPAPRTRPPVVAFSVDARQLGEPDVMQRLRHRVRVKRWGRAYLAHDGESVRQGDTSRDRDVERIDRILPVLDETDTRIQVVVESDQARYGIWIEPKDAWESIVAPVRVDVSTARPPVGVIFEAGAPITAGPRGSSRRTVQLRDEELAITGIVDAAYIGRVYVAPPETERSTDARSRRALAGHTAIRAHPATSAAVLAISRSERHVTVLATDRAWTEVELVERYVRVRGYVPTRTLSEREETHEWSAIGLGSSGTSHADRIDVPAGTCLYSGLEGEVVGVQLAQKIHMGRRRTEKPEWSLVFIGSPWRTVELYLRNTNHDPLQPAWESCATP